MTPSASSRQQQLDCKSCDWSVMAEDEKVRVHAAILHAISTNGEHVVSDIDLLERYEQLDDS